MKAFKLTAATLCLSLVLLPTQEMPRAEEVAEQFDCTACHPAKIRDFKGRRANPVTPVEEFPELPTGKQDVASSPAMCFSCHDGFVMEPTPCNGSKRRSCSLVPSACTWRCRWRSGRKLFSG